MGKRGFSLNWISRYRNEVFGIAILSILFLHFAMIHIQHFRGSQAVTYAVIRWIRRYISSSGVDIFVFLSGMGLYYSFCRTPDWKAFYGRRFRRILIPYTIIGGIFWVHVDLLYRVTGIKRLVLDYVYITFFTEGVNNLWFVFFIGVMYLFFPLIYFAVYRGRRKNLQFLLLISISAIMPVFLYQASPGVYNNINIAVTRVPIFILGVFAGKYIREDRSVSHLFTIGLIVFGVLCRHYVLLEGIKGYRNRYASSVFAIAFMLICVYCLKLADKAVYARRVLRFFGKYSLELYLLHILMWELLEEIHWELYRPERYAVMVGICAVLAPVLGKITCIISGILAGHGWRNG